VKSVIVNADDYAMDDGVDAAILALARQGVVTATSAMVLSPSWPAAARRLADARMDCGLHLDFTSPFAREQEATLARPLPQLIAAAYAGRLERHALRGAIGRQLDRFDAAVQAPPAFVDGHQHVHQLPGIREALLAALRDRYGQAASAIGLRLCLTRRWRGLKAAIIAGMGGRALGRMIAAAGHSKNSDFAGVYGFSPAADLAALWRRWLTDVAGERPLIMCHVAMDSAARWPADEIRAARLNEWKWLGSTAFQDLCAELGVRRAGWRIGG
jgi:chitin disaccharide deacetylase